MHISKVIIINYRNFENFEIDLKPFIVLVGENIAIAEKKSKLFKWLNSTKEEMESLKSDDHRFGYVAFTRVKKLLVLCCLEKLDESEIEDIKKFDIKII